MATEREAYLCLSAILRAREPKLLNTEKSLRMMESRSFEEAAKLLTDSGYADMSQMSADELDAALQERRREIFTEIERLCPQKELVDFFRMKYDCHNAKVIVKSEAMELDRTRLLSTSGRMDGKKFLSLYNDGRFKELPGKLKDAVPEAKSILARTNNPQLSDILLDKAYFAEIREAAESSQCDFLKKYVQLLIDSSNLKSAVRVIRMGKRNVLLDSVLIDGGTVAADRIKKAGGKEELSAAFSGTMLENAAALGGDILAGGSLTAFERECDNAVSRYLRSARRVSYGPETVVTYLAAVENEMTAVRMILTGKLAGIASQTIRERLRDLYA